MNPEHKFQELSQQLDRLDTNGAQSRIEAHLRSAWSEQHSTQPNDPMTMPKTSNRWRWLQLTLGGSGLATLALITTLAIQPPTSTPLVTNGLADSVGWNEATSVQPTKSRGLTVDELDATGTTTALGNESYAYDSYHDDYWVEGEVPKPSEYTYKDGDEEKQLFDESIGLSVEVKGQMLDLIHTLREQVSTLNGQLVNISYYETSGTVDIKLPADQLNTFEDVLKELDANHTVEVDSYNVINVSEEIVSIDAGIKQAEDNISQAQQTLGTAGLSDAERQRLADQIKADEDYIASQKIAREESIAEHNLVAVRINLKKYNSVFEGNYTQYDRSTFSGLIKYELGKAIYTLIRSTGKLTIFLVWLLVYSVVLVPAFLLIRWVVRKLIRLLRKQS